MRKWNVVSISSKGPPSLTVVVAEGVSVSDSGALLFYVNLPDEQGVVSHIIARGYWSDAVLEEDK